MKQLMAPSYCRFTLPPPPTADLPYPPLLLQIYLTPPPVETQGFMDSSPALNHLTNCPLKTHLFVYLMLSQTSNLYTCAVFIIQNYTDQLIPHHYQSSLA
ncbi:rCG50505, partial [Rattus norvegicus]